MKSTEQAFSSFLENFIPTLAAAEKRLVLAQWNAQITAADDTEREMASAGAAYAKLFSDRALWRELEAFAASNEVEDPLLARQLDILVRSFKGHLLPHDLIEELAAMDAGLERTFSEFRATVDGAPVTDNDLDEILQTEPDPARRLRAWEASKEVGMAMADRIRAAVVLRNRAAQELSFPDYFTMAYRLDELDPAWVLETFADLERTSAPAYDAFLTEASTALVQRFGARAAALPPWAWQDRFSQDDPLAHDAPIDALLAHTDIVAAASGIYGRLGLFLGPALAKSDLYERAGKNPHAACFDIDRAGDVRILANVRPKFSWLEIMLHEMGHAAGNVAVDPSLPWLLRTHGHTLTTEAVAMLAGTWAYRPDVLHAAAGISPGNPLVAEAAASVRRQRLAFSRWAMVMVRFERELYHDPSQNLQRLWWDLVEPTQGVARPEGREHKADWAAKCHIGTAPCYYQNYLLADIGVEHLAAWLARESGTSAVVGNHVAGKVLRDRFLAPGTRMPWRDLFRHATGEAFTVQHWANSIARR